MLPDAARYCLCAFNNHPGLGLAWLGKGDDADSATAGLADLLVEAPEGRMALAHEVWPLRIAMSKGVNEYMFGKLEAAPCCGAQQSVL